MESQLEDRKPEDEKASAEATTSADVASDEMIQEEGKAASNAKAVLKGILAVALAVLPKVWAVLKVVLVAVIAVLPFVLKFLWGAVKIVFKCLWFIVRNFKVKTGGGYWSK